MVKPTATNTVDKVVRRLREHALATEPGQLIGSEDDLVAKYSVSRPTLRQAAALVGQEQLLAVRRGVGGGYFARRPDTRAVAHMAAIYLQSRQATLAEIIKAIEPIKVEMTVLATQNRSPEVIARWREYLEEDRRREREGGYFEFLRSEDQYRVLLGAACGNRVLELFVAILYDFCASIRPDEDVYRDRPDRVHDYWARRLMAVAAIIDNDPEVAALTARRCARMVSDWIVEDVSAKSEASDSTEEAWSIPLASA